MTKSELFTAAHKIARQTKEAAGSYRIAFACALKDLYKGIATMTEKTNAEKCFDHFAECNKVYTRKDGTQCIYLRAYELLTDCSRKEERSTVIITKTAAGEIAAQMDGCTNASQRARLARAIENFAA